MALVAFDGFDAYNGVGANTGVQSGWTVYDPTFISGHLTTITGRFGGQAIHFDSIQACMPRWVFSAARSSFAIGAAFRMPSGLPVTNSVAGAHIAFRSTIDNLYQVGVRVTPAGAVQAIRYSGVGVYNTGSVSLGISANGVIGNNIWHYVEVEVVISDTVGRITVYVDNIQVLNITGADTRNGTPTTCDAVEFGGYNDGNIFKASDWDDFYEADAATRIGEGFVETLLAASDNAVAFTPSSGSNNYSRVNEAQVDGDTTYNQGTAVGDADLFNMTNLASNPASIYGVQVTGWARKTDAGARTVYLEVKSGGTTDDGAAFALAGSYAKFRRTLLLDPDTAGAWTATTVNAALGGYKIAS